MTPSEYYRDQVAKGIISSDPKQLVVLEAFDMLQRDLVIENEKRAGLFRLLRPVKLVKGIYLWGGVGIGKTFLMDCFYHTLPFENKLRMHFHQFMRLVHDKLTQHQGEEDPLAAIAKEFSQNTIVICFDEFFISDITDAMLLGRLVKTLFDNGLTLVATSNIVPDQLYKNGLQRSRFIPAIKLINADTTVINMSINVDYRLRHLQKAGVFYTPLDETAKKNMEKNFTVLTENKKVTTEPVPICGRLINVVKRATDDSVIWFSFDEICTVPRSQQDYLAVAEKFKTVFISDIPIIQANEKDKITLFITLVDVLYDARIRLVLSSAEPIENIYRRGYMVTEYTRTHSRLEEMQSLDYFTDEYSRDNTKDG